MKYIDEDKFNEMNKFGKGIENKMFAEYFTKNSFLNQLTDETLDSIVMTNVTFEPGSYNNWHIHHAKLGGGQILICTAGEGWYQQEGEKVVELKEGSVIVVPANVKHWHGAKKDSWFSHIAVAISGEETSNEWCEVVDEEEYNKL